MSPGTGPLDIPDYVPAGLHEPLAALSTEDGRKWLWWALGVLLALAFLAFLAVGANGPEDPTLAAGTTTTTTTVPTPKDNLHITAADGTVREFCVLVADSEAERALGLMARPDLGKHDGMAFVFEADTRSGFHMRNTPMPLTVAWFEADGDFVSAADMVPCRDAPGCPTYRPKGPYRLAVEIPRGKQAEFGIGPGAKARLDGECPGGA